MKKFVCGALFLASSLVSSVVGADDYDRRIIIVNESGKTIVRLYGSNTMRATWEEDVLGQSVLRDGESMLVDFNDGSDMCSFDLKIVFANESTTQKRNVNVCVMQMLTVY